MALWLYYAIFIKIISFGGMSECWKSGYFSVMKCFGFIILTRSVNTNLCNLKFWPVFTNLSTCYISFASLYFLHLQNDASLKVKTVVHEDCDRWLFFHEKRRWIHFSRPLLWKDETSFPPNDVIGFVNPSDKWFIQKIAILLSSIF